jgi:hypothetical protein
MVEDRNPRIFISYRRSDSEHVAGRMYDWLSREFGQENVFKDVDSIPIGEATATQSESPSDTTRH